MTNKNEGIFETEKKFRRIDSTSSVSSRFTKVMKSHSAIQRLKESSDLSGIFKETNFFQKVALKEDLKAQPTQNAAFPNLLLLITLCLWCHIVQ